MFAKHFWFLDETITESSKKNLILYLIFNMTRSHNCSSWIESRPIIANSATQSFVYIFLYDLSG